MAGEVDKTRLSQAFLAQIEDAIKNGEANIADKKEDCEALSRILAGLEQQEETEEIRDQKQHINDLLKEYAEKYKLNDLRERANEWVRAAVDGVKGIFAPEKVMNIDEAKMLLVQLDEAEMQGRTDDAEYIRAELKNAGFEGLLKEHDDKTKKATTIVTNTAVAKKSNKTSADKPKSTTTGPTKTKPQTSPSTKDRLLGHMRARTKSICDARDAERAKLVDDAKILLDDAKNLGLDDTPEYIELKKIYDSDMKIRKEEMEAAKKTIKDSITSHLTNFKYDRDDGKSYIKNNKEIIKKILDDGAKYDDIVLDYSYQTLKNAYNRFVGDDK